MSERDKPFERSKARMVEASVHRPPNFRLYIFLLLLLASNFPNLALEPSVFEESGETVITIWEARTRLGSQSFDYLGTGFLISPDGYILTNAHVIQGRAQVVVRLETGEVKEAEVVNVVFQPDEQGKDVALLKILVQGHVYLKLGNSDLVQETDPVCVVGYPGPLVHEISQEIGHPTSTPGHVNKRDATQSFDEHEYNGLIQIDAQVKPGSSGSPVLNESREVVGILVGGSQVPTNPYFFAIPINVAIVTLALHERLPPYLPEIIALTLPEIKADGESYAAEICFRDLNADLYVARLELLEGHAVEYPAEIYVLNIPELERRTEGKIPFEISTQEPQQIRLQVQLVDSRGNRSALKECSFEALPPHPPRIRFFHCPESVFATGREYSGTIGFEDTGGDIVRAIFEVVAGQYQNFEIDLREYPSEHPVYGRQEGEFAFPVATTVTSPITVRLTLIDAYGARSQPSECSFVAEAPSLDLSVSILEPAPASLRVGETLRLTYVVRNSGEMESGPFRAGVYLSNDDAIDAEDLLLGSETFTTLAVGAALSEAFSMELTEEILREGDLEEGSLYWGIFVDDRRQVEEKDETNNTVSWELKLDRRVYTVPDRYPTIQAAIDAKEIDIITIAPGEYGENLEIERSVSLIGARNETPVIKGKDEKHPVIHIGNQSGIDVHIEGITITRPDETPLADMGPSKVPGVYVQGEVSVTVQSCSITHQWSDALYIDAGTLAAILGNEITQNHGSGVLLADSEALLENNVIVGNGGSGIDAASSTVTLRGGESRSNGLNGVAAAGSTVEITSAQIVSNRANGIDLIDGSTGSIAKSSITQNENYGIHLSEATGNSIIENEITENKAGAIYAKSSRVTISQNDVLGNEEGGINSNGIVLASGSTGIVSGNLITRNGGCGIGLSEITDCSVKGNEITENRCHGIYANKAAASISENRIADNIGIGICGISSALQITGNEIRANRRGGEGLPARGIDLKSSTADIVANRISDHKEAGIYLKDVSKSTVQGNETVHNGCGIAVFGSQVDITNNRISEGQTNVTEGWYGYGVQLTDGSEAIILDNQISENTGAGILCVASVAEIINNHITDTIPFSDGRFGRAINVQGGSTVTIEQNRILGSAAEGISSDGSTIRIHQNYLIGNGSHGAEVIAFDSPVSISGNTILFNRGDGLVIDIESLKAELEISVTGNLVADNLCGLLDNGVRDLEPFLEANVVLNNEQQQYVKVTPREPELKLQEAFQSSSPLLETLSVLKEESAQLSSGAEMAAAESFWAPMQLLQGMLGDVYRDNGYIEEAIVRYNAAIDLDYRPSITWDARIKKARAEMTPKIVGSPLILEFPSSDDLDATQQFLTARGRPASFNPYVLTSLTTPLVELMHAGLTKTNPVTEDVEAAVAERWEISDDFTCYTFHLRNLCFSDGERLTAEDVLFTFKDVILNEQVNIVNDYGPDRFRIGDESVIERLETVDERTVRFILKQPFAPLLRMLDVPILPKHLLEAKVDANSFKEAWSLECPPSEIAGLGPFRLVEADRQNKEVYEKNPFYWKRDERGNWLPYATKLTVAYIDQPYQELLSGKIDFLTLGYNDMKDLVGRAERLGIQVISGGPQFAFYFFALNQDVETRDGGLKEIFRDRRFRRAISHAIDRQGIANTWFAGYATPQYGPIYQSSPFYVEDALLKYDFNLELVAGLLDEIGLVDVDADGIRELPDGSELEFEIMTHWSLRSLCSDIIENLEQIGIRAELRGADTSEISAALRASPPTYEAILSGWWGTTLDPTSDMMIFQSTGSFHFYRPSDARGDTRPEYQKRIDQLLHMQTTETDESQRKRLLEEFQQKFTENQDVIFIVSPLHLGAAQEGVANYANPNLVSEIGPLEVLFRKARLESPGG